MIEFLQELVSPVNLPVTILMGLVLCYWLMVIVGVLGIDVFDLDLDLDADADLDLDLDLDAGLDADVDGHLFGDALRFMHLGDVPVMIVGSIFMFLLWFCTIVANHYLNQDSNIALSLFWTIPNLIVSLLATKVILLPFVTLFRHKETIEIKHEKMIGLAGVVKTTEVTDKFGQIEIRIDGPPIVVNARAVRGRHLAKGDLAKIVAFNATDNTFNVELSKWEKE